MGDQRPVEGQGVRERRRVRGRRKLGFAARRGRVGRRPLHSSTPGRKPFDFDINQISVPRSATARSTSATRTTTSTRRSSRSTTRRSARRRRSRTSSSTSSAPRSARRARLHPGEHPADQEPRVYDTSNTSSQRSTPRQIDGIVVDLPTAFILVGAEEVKNGTVVGQFPLGRRRRSTSGCSSRRATRCATA